MLVVVLGMHRSGTSCVTRMLQQAGMYLGSDLMEDVACSNLEGHAESWEAVRINDQILERSGGAWDQPPTELHADETSAAAIQTFVRSLADQRVAGWKDPRTTLTWPVWRPHLPAYRLVACVRHPLAVARSLQVRDGWPLEKGLALWAAYNERLLEHVTAEAGVCWFLFDLPDAALMDQAQALCRELGLAAPDTAAETFNPFLRHHRPAEPVADPWVQALYERLLQQANSPATGTAGRTEAVPAPDLLAKLGRVQQLQDRVQQEHARWLHEVRQAQIDLGNALRAQQAAYEVGYRNHQEALEELYRDTQRQLTRLSQELADQGARWFQEIGQQGTRWHQELQGHRTQWQSDLVGLNEQWRATAQGLDAQAQRLAGQLAALESRQREESMALAECHAFIGRMRRSPLFRCLRAMHRSLAGIARRLLPGFAPSTPLADLPKVRRAA